VTIFVLCIKVQTLASGPGISGSSGGNIICDGSTPISSYRTEIKNPLTHELFSRAWDYVDALNKSLANNSRGDLKKYFNHFILAKKWYLYDCVFSPLSSNQIGTPSSTQQIIVHYPLEIQISKPAIENLLKQKDGIESLREILLRELFESLKILSKDSALSQCKAIAPEPYDNYCNGLDNSMKHPITLDANDHAQTRELAQFLIKSFKENTFSLDSLINKLIEYQFDLSAKWLFGALETQSVSNQVIEDWIQAWNNNKSYLAQYPHDKKCAQHEIKSIFHVNTESEARTSEKYVFKITHEGKDYNFKLESDPYLLNQKLPTEPLYKLRPTQINSDEKNPSNYHPIYYAKALRENVTFSKTSRNDPSPFTNLIGQKKFHISLVFEKRGEQFIPMGYQFLVFIISRVDDKAGISSQAVIDEYCSF